MGSGRPNLPPPPPLARPAVPHTPLSQTPYWSMPLGHAVQVSSWRLGRSFCTMDDTDTGLAAQLEELLHQLAGGRTTAESAGLAVSRAAAVRNSALGFRAADSSVEELEALRRCVYNKRLAEGSGYVQSTAAQLAAASCGQLRGAVLWCFLATSTFI